ncbi:hypothetical protein OBBRIDRAFT_890154 [Obba rivulosa]|uniref:tRNA(Ile)-lysidine synthetase n=1 Tax=Obba rivulosa TaxID=1052685 RepID=A0A8E2AME3_9APHY|nr:hypothetical protein OBBRIDRAFT_890154 [Obba rivulosa]
MRSILPISSEEFLYYFRRCTPPRGWPAVLAVANSGGPDSTCLLYLLASVVKSNPSDGDSMPSEVVSLHINHDLQKPSVTMAEVAEGTARALGVKHLVTKVPWGDPPFPSRPAAGAAIEETARYARHYALFRAMSESGAEAIAFGHHSGDQVETVVMRLAMGSSSHGLAGIRPVRRWGMGEPTPVATFGIEGMRRWIVRPLLGVSKDRILATCEANRLPYINDPTNVQPDLTIRNAVRHLINSTGNDKGSAVTGDAIRNQFPQLREALRTLQGWSATSDTHNSLREAVAVFAERAQSIDRQVTDFIKQSALPAPPSTLLLSSKELLRITNLELRRAVVRRISRLVSPRPWGSLSAEVNGNTSLLDFVVSKVWMEDGNEVRRAFSAGSGVIWVPQVMRPDGLVRERDHGLEGETNLWLVQRAPPMQKNTRPNQDKVDSLVLDVTDYLTRTSPVEVLWDNRFCLKFDPSLVSEGILDSLNSSQSLARVVVQPYTKWFLPSLVLRREGQPDMVLAKYPWDFGHWKYKRTTDMQTGVRWVGMSFIRSWDAI